MRFLVIQHIACEPPGAYEDELVSRGIVFDRIQIDDGQPLPDWRAYQAIVAMGGPMSVNDEATLPWLSSEKQAIGEAVMAGLAFWGVCLGAQLLAASLSARVYRGQAPELGLYEDLTLTAAAHEDPVFAGLSSPVATFQWHGETFDLPDDATLLAGSPAYPHQAFRIHNAYGLQFHLEVSAQLAESWLSQRTYATELETAQGERAMAALEERLAELDRIVPTAREIFGRWIDRVVTRADARADAVRDLHN